MNPPFPPANELALLVLTELLFGFTYDRAVQWFERKNGQQLFKFLVSWSVVFGTAGTLTIKFLFLWGRVFVDWQDFLIDLLCFAGSGIPMIIGSMGRAGKPSHKAKRIPTNARHVVEDVSAEMHRLACDVNEKAQTGEVKAATLIEIVHRLHQWIGMLKSL